GKVRDEPPQEKPIESNLNEEHRIDEPLNAGQSNADNKHAGPDNPGNDGHRLAHEAEVRPSWHAHAWDEPLDVPNQNPRCRDDEDHTDHEHQGTPRKLQDAEIDRQRTAAVAP